MGKFNMSWSRLLSTESQRPRTSKKNSLTDNGKNHENKKNDENRKKLSMDLRSDFERDYHRILSSPSFRRLQDKTQVFPLEKNDFIRTRLTHSIEVSSFAKSLAQSVASEIMRQGLDSEFNYEEANAISDILASSGLLHDIGNPPFGHFGEDTIRTWFHRNLDKITMKNSKGEEKKLGEILNPQMCGDLLNFEGNAQAIRVAAKLHFLIDENGMNLTYALLNTLIKYPVDSLNIDKKSSDIKTKKMGYNLAEKNLFEKIVQSTGTKNEETGEVYRHPLTFLLEAADDIAYCTADVEDGVKKKFIKFEELVEALCGAIPENKKLHEDLINYKQHARERKYDDPELYAVQRWAVKIQGIFIRAVVGSFIQNYDAIMNGEYKKDLFADTEAEILLKTLKKLAYNEVFDAKAIVKMEVTANNIINYFLDNFISSVLYWDTEYEDEMQGIDRKYLSIISETHRYIYSYYSELYAGSEEISQISDNNEKKEKLYSYKLYLRILLVTDYISGMTDSFMKTLYQELIGIE